MPFLNNKFFKALDSLHPSGPIFTGKYCLFSRSFFIPNF